MKLITLPLRYPGSKTRIAGFLASLLEKNFLVGSHMYEPFAGGASATLNLIANGFVRSATIVERDPMVYAFWKCTQNDPDKLINRIMRSKVSLRSWKRLLPLREIKKPTPATMEDLAYAGLFFNRTCFSGIVGAGPIGGMRQNSPYKIDCRFNKKEIVKSIVAMNELLKKVDVRFGNALAFLEKERLEKIEHSFVYIDPPYVSNGHKLYRYHFQEAQHRRLAKAISGLSVPWLLSYDNHRLVNRLYSNRRASVLNIYQSLKGVRFVDELLFLSADFEIPSRKKSDQRLKFSNAQPLYLFG